MSHGPLHRPQERAEASRDGGAADQHHPRPAGVHRVRAPRLQPRLEEVRGQGEPGQHDEGPHLQDGILVLLCQVDPATPGHICLL